MALNLNGIFSEKETAGATIPPAPAKYDLDAVRNLFDSYKPQFGTIKAQAADLEVNNDDDAARATEMIAQAAQLIDTLEKKRKEVIDKPDNFVRSVNAIVRPPRQTLESIVKMIKRDKLGPYQHQKEIERREAERKQREAAAAKQRELDEQAKARNVDPVKMPDVKVPKKSEPVRTEIGTSSSRMVWDYAIKDPNAVPREYLIIDERKIKAAIKAGIRKIAGVDIFEVPEVRVRRNF